MGVTRMRRATVQLAVLASLSGCGFLGTPTAASPAAVVGSLPPSSTATSSSPPTSTAPAAATAAAAPIAAPTVVTGSGDAVVPVTKPAGTTTVIATITGNADVKHFFVRAIDGKQDLLVETTAPYSGSTLLDADGGSTTQLRVRASGPWSITLSDPRSAAVFTDATSGTGDAVLVYERPIGSPTNDKAVVTGSALQIRIYSDGTATTPVWATGSANGVVPWPYRVGLVAVRTAGPWALTIQHSP